MESFSTVNVLMNLYTTVYDLYENPQTIETVKAAIAYPLVENQAELAQLLLPSLPTEFTEHNYFIIDGSSHRAELSFAFRSERLVNFNVQVYPKELFKKRAVTRAITLRLLPYISAKTHAEWETTEIGLVVRDIERNLVHNIRTNFSVPVRMSASLMAAEFAGI